MIESIPPPEVMPPRASGQQTARRAIEILISKDEGFHEPTKAERHALLVAFAARGKVLYGQAFDIVKSAEPINFCDPLQLAAQLDSITIYEIKSTNRSTIGPDFRSYFFNLTTAELLVAQSLGPRFQFVFVNTVTGEYLPRTLGEIFSNARGIYPTWSIKF